MMTKDLSKTDVTTDTEEDRVVDRDDLDDSARADSIVSLTSTNSTTKSRENGDR